MLNSMFTFYYKHWTGKKHLKHDMFSQYVNCAQNCFLKAAFHTRTQSPMVYASQGCCCAYLGFLDERPSMCFHMLNETLHHVKLVIMHEWSATLYILTKYSKDRSGNLRQASICSLYLTANRVWLTINKPYDETVKKVDFIN